MDAAQQLQGVHVHVEWHNKAAVQQQEGQGLGLQLLHA